MKMREVLVLVIGSAILVTTGALLATVIVLYVITSN